MYALRELVGDVRADYERYRALFRPMPPSRRPGRIRVLLSSPGLIVVAVYRIRFWLNARCGCSHRRLIRTVVRAVDGRVDALCVLLWKVQFSRWPRIGPGFYLSNKGGVIIGADRLGAGCVVHHNVTIGMHNLADGMLDLGDGVWIGPNAVVYGDGRIGSGVVVQASTVLGKSVPDRCVIKGNPGRIVQRDVDSAPYHASSDPDVGEARTS